jgi:hypothetical protein
MPSKVGEFSNFYDICKFLSWSGLMPLSMAGDIYLVMSSHAGE